MSSQSDWQIEIVSDWESVFSSEFQEFWNAHSRSAVNTHVFFEPSLSTAWVETYRTIRNFNPVYCIGKNPSATIFLPLVLWKQNWRSAFRTIIIPVGYSDFDFHDPLLSNYIEKSELKSFYISLFELLKPCISFDAIILNGIRLNPGLSLLKQDSDISPFCNLEKFKSPDEYLQSLKTSLRGDLRRQIRRLEEKGTLSLNYFETVTDSLKELPVFLKIHSDRWPYSYKAPSLHENIIKFGIPSGIVHFTSLKCGFETISWHLGFIHNNRYYYYMPVINPMYENYSPGKIHLFKLIEFSILNGITVFDHLRGGESYKAGWTDNYSNLYSFKMVCGKPSSLIREAFSSIKNRFF